MITIACATDDGNSFVDRHFGDAAQYAIYEVNESGYNRVNTVENVTINDEDHDNGHGDAVKAEHVMMFLKKSNVDVLVNKNFGPNINRIKIRFLPVITRKNTIKEGIEEIISKLNLVENELSKGIDRHHLILN